MTMELKEPKKKKRTSTTQKSSLPIIFDSQGELTQFHATLTSLGSSVADPTEMEIIYTMGYFGKGSLSKSHPNFGKIRNGAPPIIRNRQWDRREEWMNQVQKLNRETFFDENSETKDSKENTIELNDSALTLNNTRDSDLTTIPDNCKNKTDSLSYDPDVYEQFDNQSDQQSVNNNAMDVDEVVLDSTEEEDFPRNNSNVKDEIDKNDLIEKNTSNINDSKESNSTRQGQVLVLPDSDSDTDNYLINVKPKIKIERFPVRETLHLTFEETFFLMYGLGCLRIVDFDGKYVTINEVWNNFCEEQKNFLQRYVVYHYFRSKGWVVKPGLKYGGDFVLYKEGPPFYHSSYIVMIDVLDAVTFKRIETKQDKSMMWNKLFGLERLAEAVGKEILFAQVLWPSTIPTDTIPTSPEVLSQFTVKEILWRRWKINKEITINGEENDEEDDSA